MTKADQKTKAHNAKRAARLVNRKMPIFGGTVFAVGISVQADNNGDLYRIDAEAGTIEKIRWAR